jgi:tRNA(Ile)-lysidine synthase
LPIRFERHLKKRFPYILGEKILLAVSGGLDSMAMTHLFLAVREKLNIHLFVAHVDHNLRSDSGRDAQFVDNFCKSSEIPCQLLKISKEFWSSKAGDHEARARNERYRLLEQAARRDKITYIATAHHKDDQVETLLMRILDRGTGIRGLAGIRALKRREELAIIRPLLDYSHAELVEYIADRPFVQDPTNDDTDIRRNYFRKTVIPSLDRHLSESYREHLIRLAKTSEITDEYVSLTARTFLESHKSVDADGAITYSFSTVEIAGYPDPFWMTIFSVLFAENRRFSHSYETIEDIIQFIRKKELAECRCDPYLLTRTAQGVHFVERC